MNWQMGAKRAIYAVRGHKLNKNYRFWQFRFIWVTGNGNKTGFITSPGSSSLI
jgi:hypothetical protein